MKPPQPSLPRWAAMEWVGDHAFRLSAVSFAVSVGSGGSVTVLGHKGDLVGLVHELRAVSSPPPVSRGELRAWEARTSDGVHVWLVESGHDDGGC